MQRLGGGVALLFFLILCVVTTILGFFSFSLSCRRVRALSCVRLCAVPFFFCLVRAFLSTRTLLLLFCREVFILGFFFQSVAWEIREFRLVGCLNLIWMESSPVRVCPCPCPPELNL